MNSASKQAALLVLMFDDEDEGDEGTKAMDDHHRHHQHQPTRCIDHVVPRSLSLALSHSHPTIHRPREKGSINDDSNNNGIKNNVTTNKVKKNGQLFSHFFFAFDCVCVCVF